MTGQNPDAGWYRDPAGSAERWWDGARWTDVTRPAGTETVAPAVRRRRRPAIIAVAVGVPLVALSVWAWWGRDSGQAAQPPAATPTSTPSMSVQPESPSPAPAKSAAPPTGKVRISTPEADKLAVESIRKHVPLMKDLSEQELKELADVACDWMDADPSRTAGDLAELYRELDRTEMEAIALVGFNFAWRCPENMDR